jgi:hypothetical protein
MQRCAEPLGQRLCEHHKEQAQGPYDAVDKRTIFEHATNEQLPYQRVKDRFVVA